MTLGASCGACTMDGDLQTFGGDGGAGVGVATFDDGCLAR